MLPEVMKHSLFKLNRECMKIHLFGYDIYGAYVSYNKGLVYLPGRLVTESGEVLDWVLVALLRTKCNKPQIWPCLHNLTTKEFVILQDRSKGVVQFFANFEVREGEYESVIADPSLPFDFDSMSKGFSTFMKQQWFDPVRAAKGVPLDDRHAQETFEQLERNDQKVKAQLETRSRRSKKSATVLASETATTAEETASTTEGKIRVVLQLLFN